MKKQAFCDKALLVAAAGLLLACSAALCAFPTPAYSARENRMLQQAPTLTPGGIADGSVTAALDTYAAERFPGRPFLRALYAVGELALGKGEVRSVIFCRDGSLLRRISVDGVAFSQNIAAITRLAEALPLSLTVAVVPRRIDARSELLPALYGTGDGNEIRAALPREWRYLGACTEDAQWFRTDHHWTADGAYNAYVCLADTLGYTPLAESEFSRTCVSESFLGTTEATAGIPGITPDRIELFLRGNEAEFRVVRDGTPAAFTGLYDMQKLATRDQYAVFLGGNCGVCEITRGAADTRPQLVLLRDSFASALLPFLAQHFRILAIDPRYTADRPSAFFEHADAALVLCGVQTLTEGRFLSPAKAK